jgi:hypothetical protein
MMGSAPSADGILLARSEAAATATTTGHLPLLQRCFRAGVGARELSLGGMPQLGVHSPGSWQLDCQGACLV